MDLEGSNGRRFDERGVLNELQQRVEAAKRAGLTYATDHAPGIRRVPSSHGFRYLDPSGRLLRDRRTLDRIRGLVIPPNWSNVWICPQPSGHLQVTARDSRGRKQYRYHADYRAHREETKFASLTEFGRVLPRIRRRVRHDLSLPDLPRERVLAAVVRLLDRACIRVGNAEYARDGDSYGLTTMRDRHVRVRGGTVGFCFKGKSGRIHNLELDDPKVAKVVKHSRDLPGYQLFQYVDERGEIRTIDSTMVNRYLRDISGQDITSKHFRTWHGTVSAAEELRKAGRGSTEKERKLSIVSAVKTVAGYLGNRPATCRKHYIHPAILEAYSGGTLEAELASGPRSVSPRELNAAESAVLLMLRRLSRKNKP